jgi:hypothetical protein
VKQNGESFGANIGEYSNIPIDRHGTFAEIVPNFKKPQIVKAVLEEIYKYPRFSENIQEPAPDISTHKISSFFFSKGQKDLRRERENLLDHTGIFPLFS